MLDAARESACFASALRCRASRSGHAWSRAHTNAPQFDPWRSDRIARARAERRMRDVPGRGARHRTCGDWGRSQRQRTRQGCPYFNCNRIYTCVDALYDVTRDGAPDRRTRPRSRRPPRAARGRDAGQDAGRDERDLVLAKRDAELGFTGGDDRVGGVGERRRRRRVTAATSAGDGGRTGRERRSSVPSVRAAAGRRRWSSGGGGRQRSSSSSTTRRALV